MISPVHRVARRPDVRSPKRGRRRFTQSEEPEVPLDLSFDHFDADLINSRWYSIRIPGILPPKRSSHFSDIIDNK